MSQFTKAWPFLGAAAVGAALLAKHVFVKPIVSKPSGCAACRERCRKDKEKGGHKKHCHGACKGKCAAAAGAGAGADADAKAKAADFDVKKTTDHNYVSKTHDPKVLPSVCDAPAVFHQFLQTYVKEQWTPAQRELYAQINAHTHARMSGSPDESVFLAWLTRTLGARRVVEVGVFMGATTLALASALPEGDAEARVYALDTDKSFTDFGVAAWTKAGVRDRIDLRLAPAADSMAALLDAKGPDALAGKVDLVFIDANKTGYDVYYEHALKLLRVGGVVAIDNVYWHGAVADAAQNDPDTNAIRAINAKVIADKRVSVSTLPIADGLTLCRKL